MTRGIFGNMKLAILILAIENYIKLHIQAPWAHVLTHSWDQVLLSPNKKQLLLYAFILLHRAAKVSCRA